jgi:hypothetical protein
MHLSLHHALIAALVALALAATPALARPVDRPDRYDSPTPAEHPTPRVVTEGPTAAAKAIPRAANPLPATTHTDGEAWLVLGIALGTAGLAGAGAIAANRHARVRATA